MCGRTLKNHIAGKVLFSQITDFYNLVQPIGKGSSCEVFLVNSKFDENLLYAAKIISKSYL